jgi:hypothetical protein
MVLVYRRVLLLLFLCKDTPMKSVATRVLWVKYFGFPEYFRKFSLINLLPCGCLQELYDS